MEKHIVSYYVGGRECKQPLVMWLDGGIEGVCVCVDQASELRTRSMGLLILIIQ